MPPNHEPGVVTAVASKAGHHFSKDLQPSITLIEGLGVEGDGHAGTTVQHQSRVRRDPTQPNVRQVHLIHAELHDELQARGVDVGAADLGENITTRGLDLLALPRGTRLRIGASVIAVTGLRNPCQQIDAFRRGALALVLSRDADGSVVRKSGVMGVVETGGVVRPGDPIAVELPAPPHQRLEPV
ncbi:MAG: MOSC domain-containing protein [Nocardioidaceae bacterium]